MNWAFRHKLIYTAIFAVLLVVLIGVPAFFVLYQKPTCSDLKQNGDERGIDCGGSCTQLCKATQIRPVVLWQQAFKVTPGVYNVAAYIQNPNISAEAYNAAYTFSVYDASSTVIVIKKGTAYIPPGKNFVILESSVETGERIPARVVFDLDENITWLSVRKQPVNLSVSNPVINTYSTYSSVDADVINDSFEDVGKVNVTAVVYNTAGNAVAASKTYLDSLDKQSKQHVIFTWPGVLPTQTKACEVPTDIVLGIDRSGSMASEGKNPAQPLEMVKQAALSFVDVMQKNDAIGLVSFATNPTLDIALGQNHSQIRDAIKAIAIQTEGTQYTNIADTIKTGLNELLAHKRQTAKQALIILTDGEATYPINGSDKQYPVKAAMTAADEAKQQGVEIYTIGLGNSIDRLLLSSLASGGDHFYTALTAADVMKVYQQIAQAICIQSPVKVEIITETPN